MALENQERLDNIKIYVFSRFFVASLGTRDKLDDG